MKKLVLLLAVLALNFSFGQVWFDLGAKGGVGSGFLINKTMSDDSRISPSPGFNYFYGGKFGINFGEYFGITTDVTFNQNKYSFFQGELNGSSTSIKYNIDIKSLNVAPLLRFTKEASYLEIGPQFSFLKGGAVSPGVGPAGSLDADTYVNPKMTRLIFGFGGHMVGNEIVSLMVGLRASYTINDLANETYSGTTWPLDNYLDITSKAKTHPLDVQLVFEINYSLGYIARSTTSCGKRAAFLTF